LADRPRRYVIVGNGVAGTTCAETLRKNDPTCQVTLIGNEPYPL
jgi:NAD(P)H-nitrite reductase large subunit